MNDTLAFNLHIIAMSTLWFSNTFGINTDEFLSAVNDCTIGTIAEFYKSKGIEFDMNTTPIEEDAMLAVYEHIMGIAKMAALAQSLGITSKDLGLKK